MQGGAGVTRDLSDGNDICDNAHGFTANLTPCFRGGQATDASGNPVARQLYDAWGNVRYVTGTLPTDVTFTGQRSNLEQIGLYYFKARFYASSIGRFISADTIVPDGKNPQAFNRYSYVNNRPLNFADPTGHMADNGCQTQGCNLTDKDIGKMRYDELWNQYRACEQGKGGCNNPIEALVFTTIGLVGVGLLSEAPAAVGWLLDNLGIGGTAASAACAVGNCTNELQSAVNAAQNFIQRTGNSVWRLNPFARGVEIENNILGRSADLAQNFPTIDRFVNGVATSIKSLDLTAKTYQNAATLVRTVKGYIDTMAAYQGQTAPWNGVTILPGEIAARAVDLAVPMSGAPSQFAELAKLQQYAQSVGVTLNIFSIP
jgi:RHS repeat-associated protein